MARTKTKKPEPFYKEAFCKAVTGYTPDALRKAIREGFVIPIDNAVNLSVGRDMPREGSEEVIDRYEIL